MNKSDLNKNESSKIKNLEIANLIEKKKFKELNQIIKDNDELAKKIFLSQKSIQTIQNAQDLFSPNESILHLVIEYKNKCCELLKGKEFLVPLESNYRNNKNNNQKNDKEKLLNFRNYKIIFDNEQFNFYFNCFIKKMVVTKMNKVIQIYSNQNNLKISLKPGNYTFNLNDEVHQIELKI